MKNCKIVDCKNKKWCNIYNMRYVRYTLTWVARFKKPGTSQMMARFKKLERLKRHPKYGGAQQPKKKFEWRRIFAKRGECGNRPRRQKAPFHKIALPFRISNISCRTRRILYVEHRGTCQQSFEHQYLGLCY